MASPEPNRSKFQKIQFQESENPILSKESSDEKVKFEVVPQKRHKLFEKPEKPSPRNVGSIKNLYEEVC
jgi:hypothetical protein